MEQSHPDLGLVRARFRGAPRFEDLPVLDATEAGRWSSAGVTKGTSSLRPFLRGFALCLTLAAAPLLVLVAIGAWASMP